MILAMTDVNKINAVKLTEEKYLKTLVENRTIHTLDNCELNVFETYTQSDLVSLLFNDFVVTSMLRGKKVMHLLDDPAFEYLPGESVLVPAGVTMKIDFPEASNHTPTQCIALAIDNNKIQQTLQNLNEKHPRQGSNPYWQFNKNNYHFCNNIELTQIMNKVINHCSSTLPCKDILADLALQELIVNIIQIQNLKSVEEVDDKNNPLSFIITYIKANITDEINLEALSKKACMSKSTFYRTFKKEFGLSPNEYIINERIKKAKQLLQQTKATIKSVCFECGFSDVNYFARLFRSLEGIPPSQYQEIATTKGKVFNA